MNISISGERRPALPLIDRSLVAVVAGLVIYGFIVGSTFEQILGYLMLLFAALLPGIFWLKAGAPGIPALPAVALAYIPYFAWPALTAEGAVGDYTAGEVFRAALTVCAFLLTATMMWKLLAGRSRTHRAIAEDHVARSSVIQLTLTGLAIGLVFQIGTMAGWMYWTGTFFGLIRSISLSVVTIACFLIGLTYAKGVLRGRVLIVAIAAFAGNIALTWGSLFLVSGLIQILALVLGYVLITRRIPWLLVGTVFILVSILHAGKSEMRSRYWNQEGQFGGVTSLFELPQFAAEWFTTGVAAITEGRVKTNLVERASLLQILLRAQSETPDTVPYLGGETYALLPSILVPRFIDSGKPASQVGMDLLNIHYGILTREGATATAVGWGLVAEAYANFGYLGVIGVALLLGTGCSAVTVYSANRDLLSAPTLVSIAIMMGLINVEADFIALCSSLLQSIVGVLIFLSIYKAFVRRENLHIARPPDALGRGFDERNIRRRHRA